MSEKDLSMKLEKYARELENDPEFIAEKLSLKIIEEMLEILERKGLTQTWLAEKMGVSKAHVSRILNAPPNMTLLTVAKIAYALGTQPDIHLDSSKFETQIFQDLSIKIKQYLARETHYR